jgi:hypothetical protein
MKNLYSFHFLRLDLDNFKTKEEIADLLISKQIPLDEISPEKVFDLKKNYTTIFYDSTTYSIVAYIKRGKTEVNFVIEFMDLINNTTSLDVDVEEFTIDNILDKINRRGLSALSTQEIEFLKQNSKK